MRTAIVGRGVLYPSFVIVAAAVVGCAGADPTSEPTRTTSSHLDDGHPPNDARDRRAALLSAIYAGIFSRPISDDVRNYWVDRYNPAAGVTCRAIVQAFMLADRQRALAAAATNVSDPNLTGYIESLFEGLLPLGFYGTGREPPNDPRPNTAQLAYWVVEGQTTIDQLDALFLDDYPFTRRCEEAGMQ
jgi:hypothetical protein